MQVYVIVAFSAFVSGIAFRSLYNFGWSFLLFLFELVIVAIILLVTRRRSGILFFIVVLFFFFGVLRMDIAQNKNAIHTLTQKRTAYSGTVIAEPDVRDTYTNLTVKLLTPKTDKGTTVLVRAPSDRTFLYRDTISFSGTAKPVTNFAGDDGRIFNYRGYLGKNGIHYIVSFSSSVYIRKHTESPLGILFLIKKYYTTSLKQLLPEPVASLATGITVGERRSLGKKLTDDFRKTGLIHIIVLSGYNIAIIMTAVAGVLVFLPIRIRSIIAIAFIALFTIFVGASATVVRAALMGSIASLGVITGRSYDVVHALFIAVFFMLLWNPYTLLYDPSFQLSFVATLGLLLGVPLLLPHLSFVPKLLGLKELIAVTIATQIAVIPLIIFMMGTVSLVSLPMNILILPILPFVMLFVFITGVIGIVSPIIAFPFASVTYLLLVYVIRMVEWFANVPFSSIHIPNLSILFLFISYGVLLLFWWFVYKE